ncbi:MAG: hypothetical protein LBQ98_05000 [Nitrososphaerota archaeon]|jgi:uncharacterized protein YwgA|nr:hypothetical protein [Nitrososphaerota archaeon]
MGNVLSVIKSIKDSTGIPCKKVVQKVIYLIQETGEDLGFDYSIHFYGPYSAKLDSEIRYRYNRGDLNIDFTAHGHMLSVDDSLDIPPVNSSIQEIITHFCSKNPSELELLATTLYIQRAIPHADKENILNNVLRIKGDKYSKTEIKEAIKELKNRGYFQI